MAGPDPHTMIAGALEYLRFCYTVREAAKNATLTPASLEGGAVFLKGGAYDQKQIQSWTRKLVNAAIGTTACAVDEALHQLLGSRPDPPGGSSLSSVDAARVILRLVRNAFAHQPMDPTWKCRGSNSGVFVVPEISLTLDTRNLDGQRLAEKDLGGPGGYEDLIEFCQAAVEQLRRKTP